VEEIAAGKAVARSARHWKNRMVKSSRGFGYDRIDGEVI
jgi:hypothetical protein